MLITYATVSKLEFLLPKSIVEMSHSVSVEKSSMQHAASWVTWLKLQVNEVESKRY